jgi:hypothetical protein
MIPSKRIDKPFGGSEDLITPKCWAGPTPIMAAMPADGASEHDHYIYGWPKREA